MSARGITYSATSTIDSILTKKMREDNEVFFQAIQVNNKFWLNSSLSQQTKRMRILIFVKEKSIVEKQQGK